ncbi:hypothetical protein fugu_001083 [Takifugu bimaculatus]|uniref:Uncharacterized protein n=1 Tax=Takifugu bimaculatus TaxID=433685 RepID=A0A4Z2CIZ0_9TELE|nr:hypothetical protein fugu_001083 [Takifugu bimaculatus]
MMETEEEFPSQTSGFCPQDIKFTVLSPLQHCSHLVAVAEEAQPKRRERTFTDKPTTEDPSGRPQEKRPVGRPKKIHSVPKTTNIPPSVTKPVTKCNNSMMNWSAPRKRPPVDFFLFNGMSRKTARRIRERDMGFFHRPASHSLIPQMPVKGIFGSPFEGDSFSSIAHGYSTFGNSAVARPATTVTSMGIRDSLSSPCSFRCPCSNGSWVQETAE